MRFFKTQIIIGKSRTPVLTRVQAHEDLKYVYGGDTDSEERAMIQVWIV